jgi:large subunit ribosomal protein L9
MATEVLLMTDVENLGKEGDVVTVSEGYARNYLLPRKLAAPVTDATRRRLAKFQRERAKTREAELATFQALAAKLQNVSCTIAVKTGEGERLYGSVTAAEILRVLKEQGIELDRHTVVLEHPLKELGVYDVSVKLHPQVEATIKVWVVEE